MIRGAKTLIFLFVVALLGFAFTISFHDLGQVNAQEGDKKNFAAYLQRLVDENYVISLWFANPVNGKDWWELPTALKDENGVETQWERVKDIGEDYICIDQSGIGASFIFCVPFSNITFLEHYPAPAPR